MTFYHWVTVVLETTLLLFSNNGEKHFNLFVDLIEMLLGKWLSSNKEAVTATNAYFKTKDKSFYIAGIQKWRNVLESHFGKQMLF